MTARDKANTPSQLSGHVEIDETYIGGRRKGKRGRHLENKTVVMGMVERKGAFKGQVVEDNKKRTLIPIVEKNVAKGTLINTDNLAAYHSLQFLGYTHETVHHEIEE